MPALPALNHPQRLRPLRTRRADAGQSRTARHHQRRDLSRLGVSAAQLHRPQTPAASLGDLPDRVTSQRVGGTIGASLAAGHKWATPSFRLPSGGLAGRSSQPGQPDLRRASVARTGCCGKATQPAGLSLPGSLRAKEGCPQMGRCPSLRYQLAGRVTRGLMAPSATPDRCGRALWRHKSASDLGCQPATIGRFRTRVLSTL